MSFNAKVEFLIAHIKYFGLKNNLLFPLIYSVNDKIKTTRIGIKFRKFLKKVATDEK